MKHRSGVALGALLCVLEVGCGGSQAGPKQPQGESAEHSSEPESKPSASDEASAPEATESKPSAGPEGKPESSTGSEPTFPEGASVDQAAAAVPKGAARANIDPDRLAEPLQQESVYEPCKVGSQHFKLRVAVWAGHAVGVDVTTANKKLSECIDKQVRALSWPDKIHSLNTVEFSL